MSQPDWWDPQAEAEAVDDGPTLAEVTEYPEPDPDQEEF